MIKIKNLTIAIAIVALSACTSSLSGLTSNYASSGGAVNNINSNNSNYLHSKHDALVKKHEDLAEQTKQYNKIFDEEAAKILLVVNKSINSPDDLKKDNMRLIKVSFCKKPIAHEVQSLCMKFFRQEPLIEKALIKKYGSNVLSYINKPYIQ